MTEEALNWIITRAQEPLWLRLARNARLRRFKGRLFCLDNQIRQRQASDEGVESINVTRQAIKRILQAATKRAGALGDASGVGFCLLGFFCSYHVRPYKETQMQD